MTTNFRSVFKWLGLTLTVSVPSQALLAQPLANDVKHVMVVIFENTDYKKAQKLPFFNRLATEGVNFTKYYAVTHPSQPNYIALAAASTLDIKSDASHTIDARHLGNLLEEHGKSWKVYVENWPGNCFLGTSKGRYVRKHNPFISFQNVQDTPERCARIVDAHELQNDIAQQKLPDYALFIPNLDDDGHDTGGAYADKWYKKTFGPLLADPKFSDGMLLISTFDEGSLLGGNHIYTTFWGPGVKHGTEVSTKYDHYDLVRTIEDIFGLETLGENDDDADIMEDWR